ncbi:hypothetical protein DPMN_079485 [Dreissena polymorpha]|uniref:Uncharacterized protein n=1 Tax=Dreissena polymorpha TaxID=45954 RepID=A0A9D3YP48_DREPO|nr:hypothetical protein DPMN_079485 [Dreissena polymorpha]
MVFSTDKFPGETHINLTENEPVNMTCILESNPGSTISIRKDAELKQEKANTNSISYTIYGRCEDTGVHICTGKNEYPGSPRKQIDVRVLCKNIITILWGIH